MPTPPSAANYQVGGIQIIVGGVDLGDIQAFDLNPMVDVLEHYTSRSGTRKLDSQVAIQKRLTFKAKLDEHVASLYGQYLMGALDSATSKEVLVLTQPLVVSNIVITYRNESATIWSYSHTKVTVRPASSMNMNDFKTWSEFDVEIEALEDDAASPITTPAGSTVPSFGVVSFT